MAIDFSALRKQISSQNIAGAYLFIGTEDYLANQALALLRKALLPEGLEEINESRLINPSAARFIEAVETLPVFARKRLVIVTDWQYLSGEQSGKGDAERLTGYAAKLPDTACVVIVSKSPPDGRRGFVKALLEAATTVEFNKPDDAALARWVVRSAAKQGVAISNTDALFLAHWTGGNLTALASEIDKLAIYCAESGTITQADIREAASHSVSSSIFELTNALLDARMSEAYGVVAQLLAQGENPIGTLSFLGGQYRKIRILKESDGKFPPGRIGEALNLRGYAYDKTLERARKASAAAVESAIELITQADMAIRRGDIAQESALYSTIFKIAYMSIRSPGVGYGA